MDFQKQYKRYRRLINERLRRLVKRREPRSVYEPIAYVLRAGGKRVRPVLTLVACEAVGGTAGQALNAAVAIEMLHNFTLVHDDIMDRAAMRRGNETVHMRWNNNVAILAGDQLVALAYRTLLQRAPSSAAVQGAMVGCFTSAFSEVCEGQGFDEELSLRRDVTIRDYIRMIDKKTAAMIAGSTKLGGIVGGGNTREVNALYVYGKYLGRAFQLQDDLLDVIADHRLFGKTIGGDLQEGKKTFLLLRALDRSRGNDRKMLLRVVRQRRGLDAHNVRRVAITDVRRIFERSGVIDETRTLVQKTTAEAKRALSALRPSRARTMLAWFADQMLERTF